MPVADVVVGPNLLAGCIAVVKKNFFFSPFEFANLTSKMPKQWINGMKCNRSFFDFFPLIVVAPRVWNRMDHGCTKTHTHTVREKEREKMRDTKGKCKPMLNSQVKKKWSEEYRREKKLM